MENKATGDELRTAGDKYVDRGDGQLIGKLRNEAAMTAQKATLLETDSYSRDEPPSWYEPYQEVEKNFYPITRGAKADPRTIPEG